MKNRKWYIMIFLVIQLCNSYGQRIQPRILSVASEYKRTNTLKLYDEPLPEKPVAKKKKKDDNQPESDKPVNPPVKLPAKPTTSPVSADTKPSGKPAAAGLSTIYFNKNHGRAGNGDNHYYYREIYFDKPNNQTTSEVKDFYASGQPKFTGRYRKYENSYEVKNKDYDGTCTFYEEDGQYVVKLYEKGKLIKESKYSKEKIIIGLTEYNPDGKTRKKFNETFYDGNNRKIRYIEGVDNTYMEQLFYPSGQTKSIRNFLNNCPSPKGEFFTEAGKAYDVYSMDFTCDPLTDRSLKFSRLSGGLQPSHRISAKSWDVRVQDSQAGGILSIPVTYDFYNSSYELEAVFELPEPRKMSEIGVVWDFTDPQNYAFLKIIPVRHTFEINAMRAGTSQKYMAGTHPKAIEISGNQIKISIKKTNEDISYNVNDSPLQYKNDEGLNVNFNKFPKASIKNAISWNVGFYFRSNQENERVTLKSFVLKLPKP